MTRTPVDYAVFDQVAVDRAVGLIEPLPHLSFADTAEAVRRMAGRGLTDGQIAARLGCYRRSVLRIRRRHSIPAATTATGNGHGRLHDVPNRPRSEG